MLCFPIILSDRFLVISTEQKLLSLRSSRRIQTVIEYFEGILPSLRRSVDYPTKGRRQRTRSLKRAFPAADNCGRQFSMPESDPSPWTQHDGMLENGAYNHTHVVICWGSRS